MLRAYNRCSQRDHRNVSPRTYRVMGMTLERWWMSLLGREKNTPKLEAGVSMASAREQRRMPGAVTYTRGLTQQGE